MLIWSVQLSVLWKRPSGDLMLTWCHGNYTKGYWMESAAIQPIPHSKLHNRRSATSDLITEIIVWPEPEMHRERQLFSLLFEPLLRIKAGSPNKRRRHRDGGVTHTSQLSSVWVNADRRRRWFEFLPIKRLSITTPGVADYSNRFREHHETGSVIRSHTQCREKQIKATLAAADGPHTMTTCYWLALQYKTHMDLSKFKHTIITQGTQMIII